MCPSVALFEPKLCSALVMRHHNYIVGSHSCVVRINICHVQDLRTENHTLHFHTRSRRTDTDGRERWSRRCHTFDLARLVCGAWQRHQMWHLITHFFLFWCTKKSIRAIKREGLFTKQHRDCISFQSPSNYRLYIDGYTKIIVKQKLCGFMVSFWKNDIQIIAFYMVLNLNGTLAHKLISRGFLKIKARLVLRASYTKTLHVLFIVCLICKCLVSQVYLNCHAVII